MDINSNDKFLHISLDYLIKNTTNVFNWKCLQWKNFTHDCIEAFIKCKVCGKISYYTLEYSSSGRKIRGGKYQFYVKDEGVFEYEPENMNLQDLYDVFDKV